MGPPDTSHESCRNIAYASRQGAHRIQCPTQGDDPIQLNSSHSGLDPGHTAKVSGNPDRATRISPYGNNPYARGRSRACSAAGASGKVTDPAGILYQTKGSCRIRVAAGKFVQIRFPDDDRPCSP